MSAGAKAQLVRARRWVKPVFNLEKGYRTYKMEFYNYVNGTIPGTSDFLERKGSEVLD